MGVTCRARLSQGEEVTAGHDRAPHMADREAGPCHPLEGVPALLDMLRLLQGQTS